MNMSYDFFNSLKQQIATEKAVKSNLDYALKYASMGWYVLPCHTIVDGACSCKKSDCTSPGKHPLVGKGSSDATTYKPTIEQWFTRWPNANIGIATGKDKSGFFAVDVDIKHHLGKFGDESLEQLEKEYGKLPDTVTAKTGSGGGHYLFLTPEFGEIPNSTGKLAPSIDIRGEGGYIIVEPAIHITGLSYAWIDSDPIFGDSKISPSPEWLLKALRRDKSVLSINSNGMVFESSELDALGEDQRADLMKALTYCPNIERDDWVRVGMALHTLDSGAAGYDLWCQWSTTCDKFNERDQARVWLSFTHKKQTKVFKESVFYIARQHGFISATEQANYQATQQASHQLIEQINNPPIYQVISHTTNEPSKDPTNDPQKSKTNELAKQQPTYQATEPPTDPINHLFPVQALNRLAGFINAGSAVYGETVTAQAVIALAATLASRRYITPQGDSCHLYVGISSGSIGSIGELRYATRGIQTVMTQTGLRRMVRDGRLSSTQALYKTLYHSPASIYLCDDYSAMINLTKRQTTGGIEIVLNHLTQLFDAKEKQLDSPDEAGLRKSDDLQPMIIRPCLSMLALLHYSQLATFAKTSEMGRGAVEQFLFAICDNDDFQAKEETSVLLPNDLMALLRRVRGVPDDDGELSLEAIFNQLSGVEPDMITVEFSDGLSQYDALIDAISDDRRYRMFKTGARKNFRRLCTVLAAFDAPDYPVATKLIMQWSCQYVVGHLKRFLALVEFVVSDDGKPEVYQLVVETIMRNGAAGVRPSDLVNFCKPLKKLPKDKRTELIDMLIEDGDIASVLVKMPSGQTVKRLVFNQFLKGGVNEN